MHRSGTSALAGILKLCGAAAPKTLMTAIVGENEAGFWESSKVADINDELLKERCSSWDDGAELGEHFKDEYWVERLSDVIASEFENQNNIVLKDPRVCRLVPIWTKALKSLGYGIHYILQVRHPAEVAKSLAARNGFTLGKSLWLWLQHFLASERSTRGKDRTLVHYDQLLSNWQEALKVPLEAAALSHISEEVADEVRHFLSVDIKHQYYEGKIDEDADPKGWVNRAYSIIESGDIEGASEELDRIWTEISSANPWFDSILHGLHQKIHALDDEKKRLSKINQENCIRLKQAESAEGRVSDLHNQVMYLSEQLQQERGSRKELDHQLEEIKSRLQRDYQHIESEYIKEKLESVALARQLRKPIKYICDCFLKRIFGNSGYQKWQRGKDLKSNYKLVKNSKQFDSKYYLETYADVAQKNIDPITHYLKYGVKEGRNPRADFDTQFYIEHYLDIKLSGINPFVHYIKHGANEGRLTIAENSNNASIYSGHAMQETKQSFDQSQISFKPIDSPTVSVIVPVYNNLDYTLRCLYSLSRQETSFTYEVIVADDSSTDKSQETLSEIYGLKICRQDENLGFLKNCNQATKTAQGKYLVILNNDTEAQPDFIEELVSTLKDYPEAGLVGAKLIYPNGVLQEAGGLIFEDASGWNIGRNGGADDPRYNFVREVDYCSGAGIAIERKLWEALGGFDLRYAPAYYEDTDLAFQVRNKGLKVVYNPFAVLIHHEGISSGTDMDSGVKKHQALNQPVFRERWQDDLKRALPDKGGVSLWKPYREKHLLWIDTLTPTPDQDSGSVDAFNFLKIAAEEGWGVTFIGLHDPRHQGVYTKSLQKLGIEVLYKPFFSSLKDYLKEYGTEFDAVIGCRITVVKDIFNQVRRYAPRAKFIFNTVDLHFLRAERELALGKGKAKQAEVNELRRQELDAISRSDNTILISAVEQKLISELLPDAKTTLLPIIREIPGSAAGYSKRKDIAFIGGFRHTPNVDAVLYFVEEIWPIVRAKMPGVNFIVAGSHMPDTIFNLESEGVVIRGFVPDLADLFNQVRISVAPLRFGAGQKGKVVTSLGYGVPVIVSRIASEGMTLEQGEGVVVAESAEEMAESILMAYQDEPKWSELSEKGIAAANRLFSIESVKPRFVELLSGS